MAAKAIDLFSTTLCIPYSIINIDDRYGLVRLLIFNIDYRTERIPSLSCLRFEVENL